MNSKCGNLSNNICLTLFQDWRLTSYIKSLMLLLYNLFLVFVLTLHLIPSVVLSKLLMFLYFLSVNEGLTSSKIYLSFKQPIKDSLFLVTCRMLKVTAAVYEVQWNMPL